MRSSNDPVVDTSALVAILLEEPGHDLLLKELSDRSPVIGACTVVETHMVVTSRLPETGSVQLKTLLRVLEARIVPFDENQAKLACEAFDRYGKSRHPARLNFGDCLVYALHKSTGHPLLFVGDDFTQTDAIAA